MKGLSLEFQDFKPGNCQWSCLIFFYLEFLLCIPFQIPHEVWFFGSFWEGFGGLVMVVIFPNLSAWKISGKKTVCRAFWNKQFQIQVRNVEEILLTNWHGEYSWWLNQPLLQFLGWKQKMFELPPIQVNIPLFLGLHFHLTTASVEFEGTIHRLRWKNHNFN